LRTEARKAAITETVTVECVDHIGIRVRDLERAPSPRSEWLYPAAWFVADSLLEERRFELPVPPWFSGGTVPGAPRSGIAPGGAGPLRISATATGGLANCDYNNNLSLGE
jgi:hypothetical protein